MDITLATFVTAPAAALIGMRFDNAWAPSPAMRSPATAS